MRSENNMKKVGFIGWRGMVGSVLMQRMMQENDFKNFEAYFFSTSSPGNTATINQTNHTLLDAYDLNQLNQMETL
jgi:aspartate-semialdehyde dehydrogenase